MDIILYLFIIVVSAYIGSKKLLSDSIMKKLDRIQTFSLLLLLFIMGISIGMDREVVNSFGSIGLKALVLALFSVGFSILGVKVISGKVINAKEEREESDY